MWRLKVSEGGSPWLRSPSSFLGRAVWEFDPELGTPEERAEVERLRQEYTRCRFEKRESQDLLMRMQYAKLNPLPAIVPKVHLDDNAEVTEEIISASLRQALNQYCTLQAHDGHWPGDNSGIMFLMPMFIFSLYVTENLHSVISSDHQPLRLLGEMLDCDNGALAKGRAWILSHGSATAVPQWGKIFLSFDTILDMEKDELAPEIEEEEEGEIEYVEGDDIEMGDMDDMEDFEGFDDGDEDDMEEPVTKKPKRSDSDSSSKIGRKSRKVITEVEEDEDRGSRQRTRM
ncbi:achilleol B synthase-like [Hordeum vulgare]|nr:achilleol B synthase-like [Hordeum vulgare]